MKITVLAVGKAKAEDEAWGAEYIKRMRGRVSVKEIASPKNLPAVETQKTEAERILKAISPKSVVVALDERGKDISSRAFALKISEWLNNGAAELTFVIGGADGLTDEVRSRADFMLGFGKLTWPHRMVRVMLLEQLYRAQQIQIGHPYHRD